MPANTTIETILFQAFCLRSKILSLRYILNATIQALSFLSRIPLPNFAFKSGALPINQITGFFPLAGMVLGGLASIVMVGSNYIGLPPLASSIIAIATLSLLTGALHDDGLGDTADGFFGGNTPEKRLEIMKDSHIGTFAALTLIAFFTMKIVLLSAVIERSGLYSATICLITIEAASRAAMVAFWYKIPSARTHGLSANIGAPADNAFWTAQWSGLLIFAVGFIYISGLTTFLYAFIATVCTVFAFAKLSLNKIGGQTGDTLGACQQLVTLTLLITMVSRI